MQSRKNSFKRNRFLVKVRSFLRFKRKKELLTFLFFVLLSSFFWFLQLMKENLETDFRIPLRIVNVPQNLILTSELPQNLHVRVKDKGATIFSYSFSRPLPVCEVDFRELQVRRGVATLTPDYLIEKLRKRFVVGMDILSVFPESLNLSFSKGESTVASVRLISKISAEPSYGLSGPIQVYPAQVTVYAPVDKLKAIQSVFTEIIKLSSLRDTLITVLPISKIDGVKFVPDHVRVMIPIESITEKTIDIPLIGINVPDGYTMRVFPAYVRLVCSVALSKYGQVKPADFQLAVDYNEFQSNSTGKLHLKLLKAPRYVLNVRFQPDEAEVLMEEVKR